MFRVHLRKLSKVNARLLPSQRVSVIPAYPARVPPRLCRPEHVSLCDSIKLSSSSGNPVYSKKLIYVERTKTNSVKKGSGKQLTQIDFKFAQFSTVVTRGNSDHTVDV